MFYYLSLYNSQSILKGYKMAKFVFFPRCVRCKKMFFQVVYAVKMQNVLSFPINIFQINQTQTLASSLRRKRSSSQPATRTLPRMPSASKQSLEADLQFIPGMKSSSMYRDDIRPTVITHLHNYED